MNDCKHDWHIEGDGSSHWAKCIYCPAKLSGQNGPVVGSRNKVIAAIRHD